MKFAAAIEICAFLVLGAWYYWRRTGALNDSLQPEPGSFLGWSLKGLGIPLAAWLGLNLGLVEWLPPLLAELGAGKVGGGPWIRSYLAHVGGGIVVITSYWAATTFLWLAHQLHHQLQADPQGKTDFWSFFKIGLVLPLPAAAALLWYGGASIAGFALLLFLVPVFHFAMPLNRVKPVRADYGRAVARIKFGKYREAEQEVLRELEGHQDDFEGWMMLAELYANQFHDLAAAEQTICDLLNQPNITVGHAAIALHRLADWQLKIGQDPHAARLSLEEICRRAPGSHLETIARGRIAQLPKSAKELIASTQMKTIRLRSSAAAQADDHASPPAPLPRDMAEAQVKDCLARLEHHPDDVGARERLARLWALHLKELPRAAEQIEHLLALPDQPENKQAQWLAMLAGWHLDQTRDLAAAKRLLERLIDSHPRSPHTFETQRQVLILEAYLRLSKPKSVR